MEGPTFLAKASTMTLMVGTLIQSFGFHHRPSRGFTAARAARRHILVQTAREEVARDAVEVIKVSKASLDHGEEMLAIACKKAPRLDSIEGCELLRQQPSCL
eukprot:scaffold14653_cov66-Phaeocystis_antarctica.AAC.3